MKNKLTRLQAQNVKKALRKLAETKTVAGEPGVLDITYDQILELMRPDVNNIQYISIIMTDLMQAGLITRIRKGAAGGHIPRWDCSKFIGTALEDTAVLEVPAATTLAIEPDHQVAVEIEDAVDDSIALEAQPEHVAVVEAEVSTAEIKANIIEMIEFMKKLPTEMAGHLQVLTKQLKFEDENEVDALKRQVNNLEQQVAKVNEALVSERKEKDKISFKLEVKEKEAHESMKVNTAVIVRTKNLILDEVQRFIAAPSWKQKNRAPHTISDVTDNLNKILKEVGVEA